MPPFALELARRGSSSEPGLCFRRGASHPAVLDDGVKNSEALLLVQTASVLHRPWTILQVYEALKQGKQLICVHVTGSGYDFNTVREFLTNVRRSGT